MADLDMLKFLNRRYTRLDSMAGRGRIERKRPLGILVITFSRLETAIEHDTMYLILSLARDVCPYQNLQSLRTLRLLLRLLMMNHLRSKRPIHCMVSILCPKVLEASLRLLEDSKEDP